MMKQEPNAMNKNSKAKAFNPSSRSFLEGEDFDYIRKAIEEASIAITDTMEREAMIMLLGIIRKKLREDPDFAEKLKTLLGIDLKIKRKTILNPHNLGYEAQIEYEWIGNGSKEN